MTVHALLDGERPTDWRTELHYEYDFRDVFYSAAETGTGVKMDHASLCVVQDAGYKYVHFAALPALFFDLGRDPNEFVNRTEDPAYGDLVRVYAQKALSWRMESRWGRSSKSRDPSLDQGRSRVIWLFSETQI